MQLPQVLYQGGLQEFLILACSLGDPVSENFENAISVTNERRLSEGKLDGEIGRDSREMEVCLKK